MTREERPGGGTLVRHASLPATPTHRLEADLVLGVVEGEEWEMFGDVRGFDAGSNGAIYVLDFQPRVIRVFDAEGEYLHTLGGPGDGPGEITQANGIVKDPGGLLWVNDHGKMRILGLRPDGTEVLRTPFPVLSWGFSWSGPRDAEGRFWGSRAESLDGPPSGPPPPGLNESRFRLWFHAVHPETEARDSVLLGEQRGRSFVSELAGGGFSLRSVPLAPSPVTIVDPDGGFWSTRGDDWRIVRLDAQGDTVLVVEAGVQRAPVTRADRERMIREQVESGRLAEPAARELIGAVPDMYPALTRLFLDDTGRIWVLRGGAGEGAPPPWDVFDREGTFVATVETAFTPSVAGVTPRVRDGNAYFLVQGDSGVPTVVRAPLPF